MAVTSYLSEFDGATTDDILRYAKNGKTGQVNEKVASYEQSGVKGYVDQMKGQTTVSDADTVQVFDTNGVPHKIAKTELLKKSAQALPTISDISAFIALNKAGNAIGLMSIEETAKVVGGLVYKGNYDDINKVTEQGIYEHRGDEVANSPNNAWGILICYRYGAEIYQRLMPNNNSDTYYRVGNADNLSSVSWKKISPDW